METQQKSPKKVVTISLTMEAYNLLFGFASQRGQGEFISQLIVEHNARRTSKPTVSDIAIVLRELVEKLEKGAQ